MYRVSRIIVLFYLQYKNSFWHSLYVILIFVLIDKFVGGLCKFAKSVKKEVITRGIELNIIFIFYPGTAGKICSGILKQNFDFRVH